MLTPTTDTVALVSEPEAGRNLLTAFKRFSKPEQELWL